MRGIIYCYTSPSNKKYIGQTISEVKRRSRFRDLTKNYGGGGKIDNARKKYGPENFTYTVLEEFFQDDIESLHETLNDRERYWIKFYDTYHSGYNSTEGGDSPMKTEEWRINHSNIMKQKCNGKMPDSLRAVFEQSHVAAINACKKPVEQYSLDFEFIKSWDCAADAARSLGHNKGTMISKCAKGESASAFGYKWKYVGSDWPVSKIIIKTRKIGKYDQNLNLLEVYNSGKEADLANPGKTPVITNANYNLKHPDSLHKRYGFYYKYLEYGINENNV